MPQGRARKWLARPLRLGAMSRQPPASAVTFGVLGPLIAQNEQGPVPLRGARQRAVLARLLVARGRVVPVDRLVDDLWAEPADGAVAAIRTFVADLRRALEPGRPPRQPARVLVTAPPGYALHAAPDAVDAWRFEAAVAASARDLGAGRPAPALAALEEALALWRGPAYAENEGEGWARAEIDRLDELRLVAVERSGQALLALGRATEAVSELQAHVAAHPLREDAWHLLATALYRSARQGEALAALRRAREHLVTELGVDPGPGLRQLEADILAQSPHLSPPAVPGPPGKRPFTGDESAGSAGRDKVAASRPFTSPGGVTASDGQRPFAGRDEVTASADERPFVGRGEELAVLWQAARIVAERGRPGVALVSGDAGAGKSALAEALARSLPDGWTTAWGRSPEYDGAPVAWPWQQIADALTAPADGTDPAGPDPTRTSPAPPAETVPGPADDPAAARFRLHRTVAARLTAAAARGPVLLVLDDLHRADEDTLGVLAALLTDPAPVTGPVLIVGTYRSTEISPALTAALARLARLEPARVYLGGLPEDATAELVRAVARRDVGPSPARLIHRRSGGNPFFVRELARLFAAEGDAGLQDVPVGVRDVIRHRLTGLTERAQTVLRVAAVLGRDVDTDLLTALAGDASALDALDELLRAGFLTDDGVDRRLRFTHILVRDTVYQDLSAPRRAVLHTVAGEAVERLRPDDVAALAYHFGSAATPAVAGRAARYAAAAAEQAEHRTNPAAAARLWRLAVTSHDRAPVADVGGRLAAVMGLGRALAVTGHLDEARRLRSAALATAADHGDPALTARLVTAFAVPAVWTSNDDEHLSRQIADVAEQALASLPAAQEAVRGELLSALALELRGTTTDRGDRAAREAEAIARRLGRPALLAYALNARFMHSFGRTGLAPERAAIGAELVALAARHELVTFEVLGHLIGMQAHSALADLATADSHAAAADRLARRYDLPLVAVFTGWYAGLRSAVAGRADDAEAAYRAAQELLAGSAMPGVEHGLLPLALLSLRLAAPARHELLRQDGWENLPWGPYEPWVRPLLLLAADRRDAAREALRAQPDSPHDLLREARLCLTAQAAVALGDRAVMRRAHTALLPAAAELAGAGSGVLTFGPVARHLDDLVAALDGPLSDVR